VRPAEPELEITLYTEIRLGKGVKLSEDEATPWNVNLGRMKLKERTL